MIDAHSETLMDLNEAAKAVPTGTVHRSTIERWRLRGANGVRLETVKIGGRRFTSREALQRFFARTTEAGTDRDSSDGSPRRNDAAIRRAEHELGLTKGVRDGKHN